ncbi:MAG: tyrosine-protein phosphatase [Chlamydiales bacterium]|nr:tyrosine-protein phosphatase [Chlamydiales bacterium]
MLKKIIYLYIALVAFCAVLGANDFDAFNSQIESRWSAFQAEKEFTLFASGKSDAVLQQEFEKIQAIRREVWEGKDYELASNLFVNDLIRAPGCVSFAFNNTVPYFNASTMHLRQRNHIACEGPRSKDIPSFFNLLATHRVTHLVRLTDSYEGATKKCHPYWEGLMSTSADGKNILNVPVDGKNYLICTYDMAYWQDNHGVEADKLLECVLQVKKDLEQVDGLLVVHCSAGVGRTGTFLAALAIVDAIDEKEPFSIEEIVYRLSLQRPHSVSRCSQYITLHRLAEAYIDLL